MKNITIKFTVLSIAVASVFCGCAKKEDAATVAKDASEKITMVTEATFPPYEFLRGEKIVGVDVSICEEIAKEMGRELVVQDAKFEAVIPSVIAGKADLAAAGITVTEDRRNSVDFSIPYVISGITIIAKADSDIDTAEELNGLKVGVQSGTTSDTYLVDQLKQEPERFDSPAMAVAALKAGKVDVVVADIDPAKNLVKGDASIKISGDLLTKEEFAVAVKKGNKDLLAVVDKVIQRMVDNGEVEALKAKFDEESAKLKDAE